MIFNKLSFLILLLALNCPNIFGEIVFEVNVGFNAFKLDSDKKWRYSSSSNQVFNSDRTITINDIHATEVEVEAQPWLMFSNYVGTVILPICYIENEDVFELPTTKTVLCKGNPDCL